MSEATSVGPSGSEHPRDLMSDLERIEMQLEWDALVVEMDLTRVLGEQGFQFSRKMFVEAYSRGYVKARDARIAPNDQAPSARSK